MPHLSRGPSGRKAAALLPGPVRLQRHACRGGVLLRCAGQLPQQQRTVASRDGRWQSAAQAR